jgi:hypothetical protein
VRERAWEEGSRVRDWGARVEEVSPFEGRARREEIREMREGRSRLWFSLVSPSSAREMRDEGIRCHVGPTSQLAGPTWRCDVA